MPAPESSPWLEVLEDDLVPASRLDVIESEITALLGLSPSIRPDDVARPSLSMADSSELLGFLSESALHHASSGRHEAARDAVSQAAPLFWERTDEAAAARAALRVGDACLLIGQARQAVSKFELALALYGDLGDRVMAAHAGLGLGRALVALGDPGAIPLFESAAGVFADVGDDEALARVTRLLDEAEEAIHAPSGIYPVGVRSRTIPPPAE
ncbi:MAG: hypothetical protein JNL38_31255 [Myxococcales bacterium]|nr:hypothetical protein [Myxococcales bacterium]